MTKKEAEERVNKIVDTLGDADSGRFRSYKQMKDSVLEAKKLCIEYNLELPWAIRRQS